MKHNSIQDKDFLDSLVLDAKKIIRLSHEHAKVCESFRQALKAEDEAIEAGNQSAPNADAATPHNPTAKLGVSITK